MKKNEFQVAGINYIKIVNIPLKKSKFGDIIDYPPLELEKIIAKEIIKKNFPIRGIEIKFFRSLLGLSLAEFGEVFNISDVSVLKWERKKTPLELINQIAVKAFMREKLKITPQEYSVLSKIKPLPKENIYLSVA